MRGNIISLATAVSGNLYLVGVFIAALRSPRDSETLMSVTVFLILILEFINIFFIALIPDFRRTISNTGRLTASGFGRIFKHPGLIAVVYFSVAFYVTTRMFGQTDLFIIFLVSVASKFFGSKAMPDQSLMVASFVLFMGTIFTLLIMPLSVYQIIIPFPEDVIQRHLSGPASDFAPQASLVWGAGYFLSLAVLDIFLFFRRKRM